MIAPLAATAILAAATAPAAAGVPAVPETEDGLPVLHLRAPAGIAAEAYRPAVVRYGGRALAAEVKLRGRSSLEYPKQNLTLRFSRRDPFDDRTAAMPARRRMVLLSSFDDTSHLRQRLAFELWNRVGGGKVRVETRSVVVYLDGRYHGLYALVDHVDGDLLAAQGFARPASLYKAVDHDTGFFPGAFRASAFEIKEGFRGPRWLGGFVDLEALARFVAEADPRRFRAELDERLEIGDHLAWLIVATAIQATDSLAKNVYHLRDGRTGRWRVVPWDFNAAFGQDWMTGREPPDRTPEALAVMNHLFERLLGDPVLGPETSARFRTALREEIGIANVLAALDGLAAEVAAAAARDERRWRAEHLRFPRWRGRTDFTDFAGEVAYLRRWIERRWAFLLARY